MCYLDFLYKGSNHISLAMPVGVREVWSDACRKFPKPLRRKSHMLHLVDVAGVSLYLGVKIGDAPLGSSHPRSELIFFNQAFGEAVDQALQRVLLFETPGFQSLCVLEGTNRFASFLKLPLQLRGVFQEIANFTPYRSFQKLSPDLSIAANALASKAIAI